MEEEQGGKRYLSGTWRGVEKEEQLIGQLGGSQTMSQKQNTHIMEFVARL